MIEKHSKDKVSWVSMLFIELRTRDTTFRAGLPCYCKVLLRNFRHTLSPKGAFRTQPCLRWQVGGRFEVCGCIHHPFFT